ncbi:ClC family H(+)/Cl(-) exchange transporter [Clostridium fungisolvens]|uniref:H(+)/Cl(-) exchange transporter ClcA n=1 Tax=Clostridium fungisolvens TaxID=1604897 RepID=A0A6V8SKY6_9CLOT|nr:ClC family H(+)/Cl(-) exchange transporter [Clostridium fungisolvens]GFP77421.1 H(+)/Cl(-) exchange transporter ClcA [Clostridium fungisolvens]
MSYNNKNNAYNTISHWQDFKIKIMLEGIIVGIFSGLLIVFYRLALEKAEEFRNKFIVMNSSNILVDIVWFLLLIIGAIIVGKLVENEPMISGSGIPQVEAILRGRLKMNWLPVIIKKFIGGVISIGAGLSLGREGPSIQLGAAVGQGFSKIFKRLKVEERYLITSGASAGLSAAFNAPLAGVMFALEEVHKHFSPLVLFSAMSASLTADVVSRYFFGLSPVFNFQHINLLPLETYGYIIILGIVVGLFGVIYNYSLMNTLKIYEKQKWLSARFKPIIPFVLAGILMIFLPVVLGGGHSIINELISGNFTMKMLLIILFVKFLYSMISFGSGAPGGIFFPLLVLGALTGGIYGKILVHFFSLNPMYVNNFIILAMAGYFAAIVRAPITGSILITEMTGSLTHLLSLSIVSIVAYIVADLLKSEPIYESLLERILKGKNKTVEFENDINKVILEILVPMDSKIEGKQIKDLELPEKCLVVAIKKGEKEIIPRGDTVISSGDFLHILVSESGAAEINECFENNLLLKLNV